MKLKTFAVENYRSITKAEKIQCTNMTVLVGPNNEGKSNLLRALVLGLHILSQIEANRVFLRRYLTRPGQDITSFDWDRDFPLRKKATSPKGKTVFDFEFELTPAEKTAFHNETQSQITGYLPIRISIGRDHEISFEFKKKGPHSAAISKKREAICRFIRSRIAFEYVRSVRTAEHAMRVVDEILAKELAVIERDPHYAKAMKMIETLQQPILTAVSRTVRGTLKQFLTDVSGVKLKISRDQRYRAMRESCSILVDDGTETDSRMKGDGVQSLASIALIRHASESSAKGKNLILAVEEPETHLHPEAIHELKKVLVELADHHQVILTTHNPVLVNRSDVGANVLVENHRARPATSLSQIRESLGIRLSDNLQSAELVLVLEGEEDVDPLKALLVYHSTKLKGAVTAGRLAIDTLGGASKLVYKIGLLRGNLCNYFVFLDNDQAGRDALGKARNAGLLTTSDYSLVRCHGMESSEIEDMYAVTTYAPFVLNQYNVELTPKNLGTNGVWTSHVKGQFTKQNGNWEADGSTEKELKREVARLVQQNPGSALSQYRRHSFDSLVTTLERKLFPSRK
jgi:putative ATP-dependent endonuclease of OLD family